MSIIEEIVYRSSTLPGAPARATRVEAVADEARGVELAAYLKILPTLTDEQWKAVTDMPYPDRAYVAEEVRRLSGRGLGWTAMWKMTDPIDSASGPDAECSYLAILVRDFITPEQFEALTAPMRAAGIDFDNLVPEPTVWRDADGDMWRLGDDGFLHLDRLAWHRSRAHVERFYGPLTPVQEEQPNHTNDRSEQ